MARVWGEGFVRKADGGDLGGRVGLMGAEKGREEDDGFDQGENEEDGEERFAGHGARLTCLGIRDELEGVPVGFGDVQGGGGYIGFEVRDRGCAGDGENDGAALEEPGEGDLIGGGVVVSGEVWQWVVGLRAGCRGFGDAGGGAATHGGTRGRKAMFCCSQSWRRGSDLRSKRL